MGRLDHQCRCGVDTTLVLWSCWRWVHENKAACERELGQVIGMTRGSRGVPQNICGSTRERGDSRTARRSSRVRHPGVKRPGIGDCSFP